MGPLAEERVSQLNRTPLWSPSFSDPGHSLQDWLHSPAGETTLQADIDAGGTRRALSGCSCGVMRSARQESSPDLVDDRIRSDKGVPYIDYLLDRADTFTTVSFWWASMGFWAMYADGQFVRISTNPGKIVGTGDSVIRPSTFNDQLLIKRLETLPCNLTVLPTTAPIFDVDPCRWYLDTRPSASRRDPCADSIRERGQR